MGRIATLTPESARVFLERLQEEVQFLSCDQLESINHALAKATIVLREAHNDRAPLLNLPIEILHKILELIPDPCTKRWNGYRPFWRNTLADSSMLIPVTQTCRRLREVALAHPIIWTTFPSFPKKRALARQMATWSKQIPLNAVGSDVGIIGELPPNTRFRSIHLYDLGEDCRNLRALIEQISSTNLSSFSLFCNKKHDWDAKEGGLPLSLGRATNLRDLALDDLRALPEKGVPRLTHLALFGSSPPLFHEKVVNFIRECPQLESIVLHEFTLRIANGDAPNDPAPIPLPYLRHVTLVDFSPGALTHYLALLQPRVHGSSVQILDYHCRDRAFPTRFLLHPNPNPNPASSSSSSPSPSPSQDPSIKVCIGVHPLGIAGNYAVSLTTVFAHTTRRISAWNIQLSLNTDGALPLEWPSLVFSDAAAPWTVDEVCMWLYGPSSSGTPLDLFPPARSVVRVAEDGTANHGGLPALCLLPFVAQPGTGRSSPAVGITTLRVVHGFGGSCESASSHGAVGHSCRRRERLRLSLFTQFLQSGGYGSLKHFVLQVTPHLDVDERELDVLRNVGQFEMFRFERIEEMPEMPGHWDPAHRGGERYPGALW